jgi:hypothetical protein
LRFLTAVSSASMTDSAGRSSHIDQPTTRRMKQCSASARKIKRYDVGMCVMCATQSWFAASARRSPAPKS